MAQHPDLTEAIELALQFAQFVRQRQPTNSTLVRTGAKSQFSFQLLPTLREDYAVKSSVTLQLEYGQTEGRSTA